MFPPNVSFAYVWRKKKKVLLLTAPEGSICFYWDGIQTKWSSHFTSFSHKHTLMFTIVLLLMLSCVIMLSCLTALNHIAVYIIYEKMMCIISRTCTSTNHLLMYKSWCLYKCLLISELGVYTWSEFEETSPIESGWSVLVGGVIFPCGRHAWSSSVFHASSKQHQECVQSQEPSINHQDKSIYLTFHSFKLNLQFNLIWSSG